MTEKQSAQVKAASDWIQAHREDMLALWERLVRTESGNMDKAGCDAMASLMEAELAGMGVETRRVAMPEKGDLLHGLWGASNPGKPVLLCGHMDTVFPPGTGTPVSIRDGTVRGPGALDMKAGLVIALYTIRALQSAGYDQRPIRVVFPGDEENGHRNSTAAEEIRRACRGCAAALNFETGYLSDGLVVGRKGSCRFSLEVTGVAAHSGNAPERGRSAILEMAHKVIALQALNDLEHGTSLNAGVIRGGTAVNSVPDYCRVDVDVRYTRESRLRELLDRAREIADTVFVEGCTTRLCLSSTSAVMEDTGAVMALFRHIQRTAREIGYGEVTPIKVGGWSDASIIAGEGVPVVCGLGAKGEHNHTPEEYALADSLFSRTELAAASILCLEKDLV